jgi:type III secretion system FlhB-like substrate exporter
MSHDWYRRARARAVSRYQTEHGAVSIVHDGHGLSARAFHKEGHVHQAAIVENKLLGAALLQAKQMQQEPDDETLQPGGLSKRDQRLLSARQARAAALPA